MKPRDPEANRLACDGHNLTTAPEREVNTGPYPDGAILSDERAASLQRSKRGK